MFEKLYECSKTVAKYRTAPLLEERLRFLEHQAGLEFGREALRLAARYLLVVTEYLHLPSRQGEPIGPAEIEETAVQWSNSSRVRDRRARQKFVRHATRWLQFLGWWKPAPPTHQFVKQIVGYENHMRDERGLAPATISLHRWWVENFLPQLDVPLAKLTVPQIDTAIAERVAKRGYARNTVVTLVGVLRDFFRFSEQQGWCHPGFAESIRGPRIFSQESLPSGPTWENVRNLIAGCDGDKAVDIRNRAILLLLSVYGFRAGEVVRMQLDDFDWKQDRISVKRSKNHRKHFYPLCQSVGTAVCRYLREARPKSHRREVFLTIYPPFRPLTQTALWAVTAPKIKALGVPLSHYGPHALRHSCATHLLSEGLTLKEIGDHLGHRLPETTAIYTKVDMTGLREVADFDLGDLV